MFVMALIFGILNICALAVWPDLPMWLRCVSAFIGAGDLFVAGMHIGRRFAAAGVGF